VRRKYQASPLGLRPIHSKADNRAAREVSERSVFGVARRARDELEKLWAKTPRLAAAGAEESAGGLDHEAQIPEQSRKDGTSE
jgi:hypothetical protein